MNLNFEIIQDYDDAIDQILIICTIESYQKLRTPGKYIYDLSKGEISIEEHNNICEIEFRRRMRKFLDRGYKFPEEQFQEYLEFHKKHQFCKKGFNHRVILSEKSVVHKERRKLALLKLGIDQFHTTYRAAGRMWGQYPNCMVLHECMSLQMFNIQYSRFLGLLYDHKKDPFYPQIELDYFNMYHLQVNAYWAEKIFERLILKEFGDSPFSSISFDCGNIQEEANQYAQQVDVETYVTELQDLLEDERFRLERFENKDFIQWCLKSMKITGIYFMTPHFLEHFDIQQIYDQFVIVWWVNFLSLQLGFFFQTTTYDSNHQFEREGIKRDGLIKFTCVVGSSKVRQFHNPNKFKYENGKQEEETEEQKRQRYINHLKFHDRRFRACDIGCQKHLVNPKTGTRYQAAADRMKKMSLCDLKTEVERVKKDFQRDYSRSGAFHIQGVYDLEQMHLKQENQSQTKKYYSNRSQQQDQLIKDESSHKVKEEDFKQMGQTFIIEPSFLIDNNQVQDQEEDNYLINQSDNEDFFEQVNQHNKINSDQLKRQKLNDEVQSYLNFAQRNDENNEYYFTKKYREMKRKIKGEFSDDESVNKVKRFTGHDYVRYLRKEEFKGDKNDQDSYLCPAFVLYEREDILNSQSPYFLKEYCFFHTHQLNPVKSLPTMWAILQNRMKEQKEDIL